MALEDVDLQGGFVTSKKVYVQYTKPKEETVKTPTVTEDLPEK